MFPKSETMDNFTTKYEKKILKVFQDKFPDGKEGISADSSSLNSILALLHVIPELQLKKTSHETLRERLIVFKNSTENLEMFVKARHANLKQPFLICVHDLVPNLFFVVIENVLVPCGRDAAHAFTVLFCSFFILGLDYPRNFSPFYRFFEQRVFVCSSPTNATDMLAANFLEFIGWIHFHRLIHELFDWNHSLSFFDILTELYSSKSTTVSMRL